MIADDEAEQGYRHLREEIRKISIDSSELRFFRSKSEAVAYRRVELELRRLSKIYRLTFLLAGSTFDHALPARKVALLDAFLLLIVARPERAEEVAGDLLEDLDKVRARRGRWFGEIWFWKELILRACPLIWDRIGRGIQLTAALELLRRLTGA